RKTDAQRGAGKRDPQDAPRPGVVSADDRQLASLAYGIIAAINTRMSRTPAPTTAGRKRRARSTGGAMRGASMAAQKRPAPSVCGPGGAAAAQAQLPPSGSTR